MNTVDSNGIEEFHKKQSHILKILSDIEELILKNGEHIIEKKTFWGYLGTLESVEEKLIEVKMDLE